MQGIVKFSIRAIAVALLAVHASAQTAEGHLKFALVLTRHGVRSPTGKADKLRPYSAQDWPQWSVPPGNLTAHGGELMTLFGSYYREYFAQQGLLQQTGCGDAASVSITADSDQRTVATGNALAAGMFPGCDLQVKARSRGTADPLFHSLSAGVGQPDRALAAAAVLGRIGGNPAALATAYAVPLAKMERVLSACAPGASCHPVEQPIAQMPSSVGAGKGDHTADLKGPLSVTKTMAENMLIEYAEGMPLNQVGWGQVDEPTLNELMGLHTAHSDLMQRTPYLARVLASNLMSHIDLTLQQAVVHKPVAGAVGNRDSKLVYLVGHDTNISAIAGLLDISWIIDGRQDDTPPGGALVFEVWSSRDGSEDRVRTYYTSQTLDQMRSATPLSLDQPPARAPAFVPGCSSADQEFSCSRSGFERVVQRAVDPAFVR